MAGHHIYLLPSSLFHPAFAHRYTWLSVDATAVVLVGLEVGKDTIAVVALQIAIKEKSSQMMRVGVDNWDRS